MKSIRAQFGLSLIELMVALTVSSFLILGITQVFTNYKRNYQVQQGVLTLQNTSRFLNITLISLVSKAGQMRDPQQDVEYVFPERAADAVCGQFFRGAVITQLKNSPSGFCMRYQPFSKKDTDCQGNTVRVQSGSALATDRVFDNADSSETVIEAITFTAPNNTSLASGTLSCRNLNSAKPDDPAIVISPNMADFRVEFGVGPFDTVNNEQRITKFIAPTAIATINDRVLAVRYQALIASQRNLWGGEANDAEVFKAWIEGATSAQKTLLKQQDAAQRPVYTVARMTQIVRGIAK